MLRLKARCQDTSDPGHFGTSLIVPKCPGSEVSWHLAFNLSILSELYAIVLGRYGTKSFFCCSCTYSSRSDWWHSELMVRGLMCMFRIGRWPCGTCTQRQISAFVECSLDTERPSTSSTLTDATSCRRPATAPSKCGTCRRASLCEHLTDTSAALHVSSIAILLLSLVARTTLYGLWRHLCTCNCFRLSFLLWTVAVVLGRELIAF